MSTTGVSAHGRSRHLRCGCCGQTRPTRRLTELQSTQGVYICSGCAVWAARRSSRLPHLRRVVGRLGRDAVGLVVGRGRCTFRSAIPILPSADLERTIGFWRPVGFEVIARYDGYLVTHADGVELHFTVDPGGEAGGLAQRGPGLAFVHVQDALVLWKRLRSADLPAVGPIEEREHGLREFVVTDPDGNRVRFGSPTEAL